MLRKMLLFKQHDGMTAASEQRRRDASGRSPANDGDVILPHRAAPPMSATAIHRNPGCQRFDTFCSPASTNRRCSTARLNARNHETGASWDNIATIQGRYPITLI